MSKEIILKKETLTLVCDAIELEINRRAEKSNENEEVSKAIDQEINRVVGNTAKTYRDMLLKVLFGMEGEEENGK
jgi:hypothetical protein